MNTPKSRNASSGAPQKNSPRSVSSPSDITQKLSPQAGSSEASQKVSPRVVRQLKTSPRYFEHTASSLNLATKPLEEQSPKVSDHRSPRSSASEKKRPSRVSELESQVSQLENDLNTVKDQLCATEASKKQAEKDAEEANHQILALSSKLDELQKKLSDNLSPNDLVSYQELETVQEKDSSESAALASAVEEIKRLKLQLEVVTESEATHSKISEAAQAELSQLKQSFSETQLLVEDMKRQLKQSEESEAQSQAMVRETLTQLENAKKMMDSLRPDGVKGYDDLASDLEKSRARVNYLEELVGELKAHNNSNGGKNNQSECIPKSDVESAETESSPLKLEVQQLRSALEAAEIRYNEEQARSKEHLSNALKMAETTKSEFHDRETKLEAELQTHKDIIEELKAKLLDRETELQGICEENEGLTKKLETILLTHGEDFQQELDKSRADLDNLKALLRDKENERQNAIHENERLKSLLDERSPNAEKGEIVYDVESLRASEREALMKVGNLTEEVDRSNRKVARITEQLDAVQSTNSDMEAELRRIKVQSDQWRKAAEAAAAMLSAGGNNGELTERTGSMDSRYSPRMKNDDLDEELLKKKNASMLRRFWKKPQK